MELITAAAVDAFAGGVLEQMRAASARRLADRQHDRALLAGQLESVRLAVVALDDLGMRLLMGFRNPEIWTDCEARSEHIAATRHYLDKNVLRPALVAAQGGIRAHIPAAGDKPHGSLRKVPGLVEKLTALDVDITSYVSALGPGVRTGVFGHELEWLCTQMGEGPDAVAGLITSAQESFDRTPSDRIIQTCSELEQRLSLRG